MSTGRWCRSFLTSLLVSTCGISSLAWAEAGPGKPELVQPSSPTQSYAPVVELRGFAGMAPGAQVDVAPLQGWRVEVAERVSWSGRPARSSLTDVALYRQVGPVRSPLWARAGYQYQNVHMNCASDTAHTFDLGIELRHRSQRGSLIQFDIGLESLYRDHPVRCTDSAAIDSSSGLRVALLGQLAITRHLGLFGRLGLRTAEHLIEIQMLPQAEIGFAIEL